jgi:uncharacterized RDD family membrane protein YckC
MKPTAVVGRRVAAWLIDSILLVALNTVIFFALAEKDQTIAAKVANGQLDPNSSVYGNITLGDTTYSIVGGKYGLYLLIILVLNLGYWVVWQGRTGATLGKAITGIRVVKESDGTPPGMLKAFLRQLLWIVDAFPYLIPNLTGFILALSTQHNKRVGDMVAGTVVVKREFAGSSEEPRSAQFDMGGLETTAPYGAGLPSDPVVTAPQPTPAAVGAPAPMSAPQAAPEPAAAPGSPPADWYPDPKGEARLRYWDGSTWTDHTAE